MISFDVSREDARIIRQIVQRAAAAGIMNGTPQDLEMDIEAVHANGTPLRLAELLDADEFNFRHDVVGIQNCIDRDTGGLCNHFLPRYFKATR